MACLLAFVLVFTTAVASAKHPMSQVEARNAQHALSALTETEDHIAGMARALSEIEQRSTFDIIHMAHEAHGALHELLELTVIYQRMVCAADKGEVLQRLSGSLKDTKGQLEISIKGINAELPFFRNPAALAEATAIRDKLEQFRAELEEVSY
jgi:hypothetical protein